MEFVGDPVEEAEQHHPDTSQNRPMLPELWRECPECCQAEHRIQQTVQYFINIADLWQGKAAARLMRQKKNGPHNQGHWDHTEPIYF